VIADLDTLLTALYVKLTDRIIPSRGFTRPGPGSKEDVLVRVLTDLLGATDGGDRWNVSTDTFWCKVTPREAVRRAQGWKLHVSATWLSAEAVLARSLPVLLKGSAPFKFASTTDHVAQLNARHTPRGQSGKFITVYPQSDEEAIQLACELNEATAGLPGPRILSDRPYAADSLVHYRYGAFVEERKLSNDGFYTWVMFDPDGNLVEDKRVAQYLPPAWAPCPFPAPGQDHAAAGQRGEGGGLLKGRFLVREAIRHANKGGVYRAVDTHTGNDVVIKEARPHVAVDAAGRDVRDFLRAEAHALERSGDIGVAPRLVMLFEQGRHLFLAEELIPGVPLRRWVPDRLRDGGWRRRIPEAMEMVGRVVELMDMAHRGGLILRDFNPNNIMVRPDGELRLVDLELAVLAGEPDEPVHVGTVGYGAPEQLDGALPTVEADYFSLGATICYVVSGDTPYFLEDVPQRRAVRERLAEWLAVRGETLGLPADLRQLILGLMDDDPEHRWTTREAQKVLALGRNTPVQPGRSPGRGPDRGPRELREEQCQEAVEGLVAYLLTSMNPTDSERLWPVSPGYGAPDPCPLQLGAAGILGTLTRYFELTGDQRLPEVIAAGGRWISERLRADAKRPPGLYFGEAGIAWSLYDAGRAIGDDRLAAQGAALAETLPVSWPSPDVTHGTAGIGLTFLHLWLRTGERRFADRAHESAEALLTSAIEDQAGVSWPTPAEFDSRLAGRRSFGFAHGTAGVGYFLAAMAHVTGRSDCLALACRAGETLLANAIVVDDMALWGVGSGDGPTAPYWCHGSSGIGTFLIRLHSVSKDDRFAKAAHMSARAVVENTWRGVLAQCHGLAGNGDFLLDMAEREGGQSYAAMANHVARVIFANRAYQEGRVVFPDERGGVSASWADGASGVLAFLLRLRHRSPRLWMVDLAGRGADGS
jgi:tRNA A-37 threonylcarbamoyl transferase component Bud32